MATRSSWMFRLNYFLCSLYTLLVTSPGGNGQPLYSSCYVFGTEHVLTFDRARIDVSSKCQFLLSYTCPAGVKAAAQFQISIHNVMLEEVSKVNCVQILYASFTVKLCSDQTATVDGEPVTNLLTANSELMIYSGTEGRSAAIHVTDPLTNATEVITVSITPSSTVRLDLPDSYTSKLCGLCGNYDGDSVNDLSTADGTDVSALSLAEQGAAIAGSYLIVQSDVVGCQSSSDVLPFTPSDCSTVQAASEDITAQEYCGVYNKGIATYFESCIDGDASLTDMFEMICVYDFCENYVTSASSDLELGSACLEQGDCVYNRTTAKEAVNRVADVYVGVCRELGFSLPSWRADYLADLTCLGDTDYTFAGPKCPEVCGFPADRCVESNRDGCACPLAEFQDGASSCVDQSACGCFDPSLGSYHSIGETWIDSSCSTQQTCVGNNEISLTQISCSRFATCEYTDSMYSCVCGADYEGDGYTCDRFCPAGSQPTSDQSACEKCPVGMYQPLDNQAACFPCPEGTVTSQLGSTSSSSCMAIELVPESQLGQGYCINDIYDFSHGTIVPSSVLPDGLPFGYQKYTSFYTSTNGLISFGKPFIGRDPVSLLTLDAQGFDEVIAAPFWFRQDLRRSRSDDLDETRLCMTSYNVVDGQEDIAEESIAVTSLIQSMLKSSSQLTEIDFKPTYAFVATWYKSIAFPYIWYDAAGYQEFTSYQAVIATDGTRTYLMYIYPSGPNQVYLRRLNEFRNIYMGYNAQDGVNLFSVYVSSTSEIVGLHTEPSNTEVAGRWVFSVSNTGVPSPYAQRCIDWYLGAKATYPYGVEWNAPCPCTSAVARRDFTFWFDSSTNCAYSLFRLGTQNNYLMCCYSSLHNSLLSGPEDAGFPISYSPFLSPTLFAQNDLSPFGDCCAYSDYCALFREFKPILTCVGYSPPRPASQFGEPHIYTLDGYLYTYNPIGEFWMIKSDYFLVQARTVQSVNDQEQLVLATQIQAYAMQSIRPLPFTDRVLPDNVSDIIHVELNNNRTDLLLYRNGESWTHLIDSTVDETLLSFNGGTIRKANESLTVVFDSGFTFRLFARFGILNCQNLVPELARGKVAGLLGDYDGDIENDITDSSGKLVCTPANCTSQIIHQLFGESWRINASESILWYRSGWNSATYTDLTFVPLYFDMTTVNQTVQDVCNNDQTCMYDTITMDSSDVGIYTSLVRGEIQDLSVTFSNTPPSVTGPTRIDARISQAVTASYTYSDADGDSVSLVVTSSPPGANVVESPGTWTITWTPVDFNPVSLSMYAVEDLPVNGENITSVELVVMFRITPDCQNGEPDYDLLAPSGTVTSLFSVYTCNCSLGWEGDACDTDIDGCADNPCYNTTCIDIPANETDSAELYRCAAGDCPLGFNKTENAMVDECFDLDECIVNMPCSLDLCVNTYGSFYCNCETGFIKHGGEGSLCEDIDECSLNLDNCTDICTNTNGSYECSCFPGGTLQSDNATCEIIVTDTLCNGLYNCSYTCGNGTDGNESCFCPRNRVLDPNDNSTCIPFNECLDSSDNACDTSTGAVCEDLTDGYQCSCTEGYILSDNGFRCEKCRAGRYGLDCTLMCHCEDKAKTCDHILGCTDCNDGWGGDQCKSDIDECSDALANNISICPTNSNCINTNGSYSCICETGYQMNTTDNTCDDVDECPAQPCSADAECFNAAGSYSCQCNSGFTGDGFTCSNINECLETPSRCVTLAKCVDLQPGFGCICRTGYSGDGRVNGTGCADDNECKETGQACPTPNSECVNTEGSYICQCQEYYTGDGYTSCVDTDECATGTANCTEVENGDTQCVNEEPLFSCQTSCLSGYIRYSVGGIVTCENIDECLSEPSVCPGNNVMCLDADGSFECICDENFEEVNGLCVDIDECLDTNTCPSNGHVCVNLIGGFDCACQAGHLQPNCTLDPNSYFLAVSQLLQTPFLPEWADLSSPEFVKFGEEFERSVSHLFNLSSSYQGINVLNVSQVPANPDQTFVSFEVVYNEDDIPVDLEQRVFYALVEDNFQLTFNDTVVADLAQIQFNGETLDCSVVRCENNFTCVFDGYPYCDCSSDYTGYDCSVMVVTDQESSTNLLPLWISVGIASALLVVGLGACCAFLAVSYRRRHLARHRPPLHRTTKGLVRTPRGPTIFNPTQRMPTEAYNYQFPVGSVRSSSSDTSSISSHQTSLTSAPVGRIGSSMPFAPRWPRAYYKQLDDEDN